MFALIAACIWGIVPLFEKVGLLRIDPLSAVLIRILGVIIGGIFLIIFRAKTLDTILHADVKTFSFLLLGGFLASFLGQIFFYRALKEGEISQVVPIAAAYPLISFLIGLIFLHEKFTLTKALGIIFVFSGILFLK